MNRSMIRAIIGLAAALTLPAIAVAQPATSYRVTVTNLTRAQPITPPLVVTHRVANHVFRPGKAASPELATLAEEGNPMPLAAALGADPAFDDVVPMSGIIPPGGSESVVIESRSPYLYLSVVGMLATTNDAFFGLDSFLLLGRPWVRAVEVPAYDAGSERNSESCDFIPGPPCGSAGVRDTDGAEGFITVHNGIYGIGDLDPTVWNWHNPVARVTIVRLPG
jgi:hypothetical protein